MESGWLTNIAAGIGAITGAVGLIVSIISYRQKDSIKRLDLRVEARRLRNDISESIEHLTSLRESAIKSRKAVASATGLLNSGAMKKWQNQWDSDDTEIQILKNELSKSLPNYDKFRKNELEKEIIYLDNIKRKVDRLIEYYNSELSADESTRNRIHQEHITYPPNRSSS